MEIKCEGFILRDIRKGDEESIVAIANNPKIANNLRDHFPQPYTLLDAQAWVEMNCNQSPVYNFAIEYGGYYAGGIGIIPGSDVHKLNAEIGYWLGEPYWRLGIMTNAVRAMTRYAFLNFDFIRLYACIFEHNYASMRVLEKAGYHLDYISKQTVIKNGKLLNEHHYSIYRNPLTSPGI